MAARGKSMLEKKGNGIYLYCLYFLGNPVLTMLKYDTGSAA